MPKVFILFQYDDDHALAVAKNVRKRYEVECPGETIQMIATHSDEIPLPIDVHNLPDDCVVVLVGFAYNRETLIGLSYRCGTLTIVGLSDRCGTLTNVGLSDEAHAEAKDIAKELNPKSKFGIFFSATE